MQKASIAKDVISMFKKFTYYSYSLLFAFTFLNKPLDCSLTPLLTVYFVLFNVLIAPRYLSLHLLVSSSPPSSLLYYYYYYY